MTQSVTYVSELPHAREVSLLGTADLNFWTDWLRKEGLAPAEKDGKAQLLLIAAAGRFMGVNFSELSFSVLVGPCDEGKYAHGAYLVQAFNSVRFFAFCERFFFSTPYEHGVVEVRSEMPASVRLAVRGEELFRAEMSAAEAGSRGEPAGQVDEGWQGPVFLPERTGQAERRKLFFARIHGSTQTYPFSPNEDRLTIQPTPAFPVLQALLDSHFRVDEWAVRPDAYHAKSKTYRRADAPRD